MRILLTGSGGFIGRNIKEAWKDKYNLLTPRSYELNLLDQKSVKDYLMSYDVDIVVHAAKTDSVYNLAVNEYEILDENLRMFLNLAEYSGLYDRMLYFGSGAEYDKRHNLTRVKETDIGKSIPSDPYGFAKYVMSNKAQQSKNIYELCLFGVYGRYEDYSRRFITNNLCNVMVGKQMTIHQNARFDYLYVNDLCRILEWFVATDLKWHNYNVCSGNAVELMDLARVVGQVTGADNMPIPEREGFQADYTGDNTRLITEMGNFSFTSHEDAIRELYVYLKSETCLISHYGD